MANRAHISTGLFPPALSGAALALALALTTFSSPTTPPGVASPALGQEVNSRSVRVEYDEKEDLTRITLNPMVLVSRRHEELRLGAAASYKGRAKARPKQVALLFFSLSGSDADKYASARKLSVRADGRRLDFGETQRSKQSQNGLFVEAMTAVVPFDDFSRVCMAKEVTVRLGFTEVKLSADQLALLRAAASYMTQ